MGLTPCFSCSTHCLSPPDISQPLWTTFYYCSCLPCVYTFPSSCMTFCSTCLPTCLVPYALPCSTDLSAVPPHTVFHKLPATYSHPFNHVPTTYIFTCLLLLLATCLCVFVSFAALLLPLPCQLGHAFLKTGQDRRHLADRDLDRDGFGHSPTALPLVSFYPCIFAPRCHALPGRCLWVYPQAGFLAFPFPTLCLPPGIASPCLPAPTPTPPHHCCLPHLHPLPPWCARSIFCCIPTCRLPCPYKLPRCIPVVLHLMTSPSSSL